MMRVRLSANGCRPSCGSPRSSRSSPSTRSKTRCLWRARSSKAGLRALELTLRTPVAMAAAAAILQHVPQAIVGVGTILTPADLAMARQAGAHFGVSPGITAALLDAAAAADLPFIPGIQSASELMEAAARGFDVLKLFPAASLGRSALQSYAGPFPHVRFCPTGGVGEDNFMDWLALPNVVAVGGSWLASRSDISAGNWSAISDRARRAMDKVRAGKSG